MNRLMIALLLLGWFINDCNIEAQVRESLVVFQDTLIVPEPIGEVTLLQAKPSIPSSTPGDKIRQRSWMNLYYSEQEKNTFYPPPPPSRFIYTLRKYPIKELHFLYIGTGEEVALAEYKTLKFSSVDVFFRRRPLAKELSKVVSNSSKLIGEVSRWMPDNLRILYYDTKRKGYYSYRIGLVIYCDYSDPSAYFHNEHP